MLGSARAARNCEGSDGSLSGDGFVLAPGERADDFPRGFLAAATAIRDGQVGLDLIEGGGAASDDFAQLAIGDGVADADVHGGRQGRVVRLDASQYK
jgi:hypothetical protein